VSSWWEAAVVYEIYPRSFQDSDGDGVGDLRGITSRLDYLAWLGVDAIWLAPIYASPMADLGYDVSDYRRIAPDLGTDEDFEALVADAHERGIRVLGDLVLSHTSIEHPWFRDHPDRYVWADGGPPNNWVASFGGPAWSLDERSGRWFLHSFFVEQPDLDWRNPEVRSAMHDVFRFWLDRGVDGFRIDVAHFVMKDPQLRDNPLRTDTEPLMHKPMSHYDTQEHLYDKNHPDVHEVYREIRSLLDKYKPPPI
jgi:alpha-glucosidase